jgi:hypothetical protein
MMELMRVMSDAEVRAQSQEIVQLMQEAGIPVDLNTLTSLGVIKPSDEQLASMPPPNPPQEAEPATSRKQPQTHEQVQTHEHSRRSRPIKPTIEQPAQQKQKQQIAKASSTQGQSVVDSSANFGEEATRPVSTRDPSSMNESSIASKRESLLQRLKVRLFGRE